MHVGRRAAGIHDQQRAESRLPVAAVGQQARALHHGRGCRHQHAVEHRLRAVDALRMHDAVDEHVADRGARGLDVEHVEFRHHVAGDDHRPAGEPLAALVHRAPVAREHDRAGDAAPAERLGVVHDDLAVAAVGAAGQEQDVRRERLDPAHVGRR